MHHKRSLVLEPSRRARHGRRRVSGVRVFEDIDVVGGSVEPRIDLHARVCHDDAVAGGERQLHGGCGGLHVAKRQGGGFVRRFVEEDAVHVDICCGVSGPVLVDADVGRDGCDGAGGVRAMYVAEGADGGVGVELGDVGDVGGGGVRGEAGAGGGVDDDGEVAGGVGGDGSEEGGPGAGVGGGARGGNVEGEEDGGEEHFGWWVGGLMDGRLAGV